MVLLISVSANRANLQYLCHLINRLLNVIYYFNCDRIKMVGNFVSESRNAMYSFSKVTWLALAFGATSILRLLIPESLKPTQRRAGSNSHPSPTELAKKT